MMENRSFDHMLGFSGIPGTEIPADVADRDHAGEPIHPNDKGVDAGPMGVDPDPDHDFKPVMLQMYGRDTYDPKATPTMNHFIASYANTCREAKVGNPDQRALNIVKCQPKTNVPVLTQLASNYALCTNWFSSLPGPTLPNRMFAHTGTSQGRLDMAPFDFNAGNSIYQELAKAGISSTIYAAGWSITATFPELGKHQDRYFGTLDDFYQDAADNDLPGYCFLEPRYASEIREGIFRPQNDQHPDSDLIEGEELILSVYDALRLRRELWESTVFILTWDEHGGIYDHVVPPAAIAPDDKVSMDPPFNFTRYGVRVPAVIISPYTPHKIITEVCDHTSLIACARKLLTGTWQDDTLGARARRAYPLDAAFDFSAKPRGRHEMRFTPRTRFSGPGTPRPMNHLQKAHVEWARHLEIRQPAHRQTGINPNNLKTDIEAQQYVRSVYSKVAGFPTPWGRNQ